MARLDTNKTRPSYSAHSFYHPLSLTELTEIYHQKHGLPSRSLHVGADADEPISTVLLYSHLYSAPLRLDNISVLVK